MVADSCHACHWCSSSCSSCCCLSPKRRFAVPANRSECSNLLRRQSTASRLSHDTSYGAAAAGTSRAASVMAHVPRSAKMSSAEWVAQETAANQLVTARQLSPWRHRQSSECTLQHDVASMLSTLHGALCVLPAQILERIRDQVPDHILSRLDAAELSPAGAGMHARCERSPLRFSLLASA